MLRLRKALEEKLKKSAATAGSSNSSSKMTCEDVDRPRDTREANEGAKPCKICRRPVSSGHECNSQAIRRWLAIKNARSRRMRNMKRRTSKRHVVSGKSRFARHKHHGNRYTSVRKRAMYQRFTCTKRRGRAIRTSSGETKHKYALLKSSKPTVHIRRGIRNSVIHKRVACKRPTSTKQSIQRNRNTSRRPIKKRFARRRCVSSRPISRRSLSHKSQVRAGHRMPAVKRSQTLGTFKLHSSSSSSMQVKPTISHLPRRSRSCPSAR